MFFPGDFTPRITATLLEQSLTNDIGYTVWVESSDPSERSVFLSRSPDPHQLGDRRSVQVRTNRTLRRLQFRIVNTGNEAIRQSTQRRDWEGVDWRIDGEWLPNTDTVWFIFRDDLILPGESRSMEILLPPDVTAIRLRWLAQPASALYRLAWTYPWAFKPKASQFLTSFIGSEDPTSEEKFLTSDPIPLSDRPATGDTYDVHCP
jgi:hypothetical protein